MVTNTISLTSSINRLRSLIITAIALNLFFLGGTSYVNWIFSRPDKLSTVLNNRTISYILSQFTLSSENTLATWYSSLLLLITGLLALICYLIAAPKNTATEKKRFRLGWIIISCIFLGLSLDEIGSFHENAGKFTSLDLKGETKWEEALAIPILIVVAFIVSFAWLQRQKSRLTFVFLILGTLLFATIPFQEHLEMQMWEEVEHAENWHRPIVFTLMEEGTELFASLCFIIAMVAFLNASGSPSGKIITLEVNPGNFLKWFYIFSGLGLAAYLFTVATDRIFSYDKGIAVNWFPMASSIIASILVATIPLRKNNLAVFYGIMISAYFGTNVYSLLNWKEISVFITILQWVMTAGLIYYIFSISYRLQDVKWRANHIAAGLLILPAFIFDNSLVTLFAFLGFLLISATQIKYATEA
jgi:hypothetical protein